MLKLGSTEINKGYLGGTEIKKGYLGNNLVFDNSIKYYLELGGNVQQDYLYIPQSEKTYTPVLGQNFEFSIDVTLPSIQSSPLGLLGYSQFNAGSNSRWYLHVSSTGNITFKPSRFVNLTTSATPYLGQRVVIKGVYIANNGVELYINNNLVASSSSTSRPLSPLSTQKFFIGSFGNSSGDNPEASTYLDGKVHGWDINGDKFSLLEGSGFNTLSDNQDVTAYGVTSNTGQLVYWNSNVWTLE